MAINYEDPSPQDTETLPPSADAAPTLPPPAPPVVEQGQTPSADVEQGQTPNALVTNMPVITTSWKRSENFYKNASLALRATGCLFSFLALIIMATNKHDGQAFDHYEEYNYLLAIAVISTVYTGGQVILQVHELLTGVQTFSRRNLTVFDFIGDQLVAYLLISAGSAAVPLTDRLRQAQDIILTDYSIATGSLFTDSSSAAIAMAFMAFFVLALSALVSAYKLSRLSYF